MATKDDAASGLRNRLRSEIIEKVGPIETGTLRQLAVKAGVGYTVLAKFIWYTTPGQQTHDISERNLEKIANALGTSTQKLRIGIETQQRSIFPFLMVESGGESLIDPASEVRSMLKDLRRLPRSVQVRACREAVSAMMSVISSSGARITPDNYASLIRLDHLQRAAG